MSRSRQGMLCTCQILHQTTNQVGMFGRSMMSRQLMWQRCQRHIRRKRWPVQRSTTSLRRSDSRLSHQHASTCQHRCMHGKQRSWWRQQRMNTDQRHTGCTQSRRVWKTSRRRIDSTSSHHRMRRCQAQCTADRRHCLWHRSHSSTSPQSTNGMPSPQSQTTIRHCTDSMSTIPH